MKNQKKGFTLIELLVVIAIIGLLATLSVVALNNARERARDVRRVSDIRQIQTALELHFNAHNAYPVLTPTAEIHLTTALGKTGKNGLWDYMNPIPSAPTPFESNCDVNNNKYMYLSADGKTYTLKYCLGNETGGISAGVRTATEMKIQ